MYFCHFCLFCYISLFLLAYFLQQLSYFCCLFFLIFFYYYYYCYYKNNLYTGETSPLPQISNVSVYKVYHDLPTGVAPLLTNTARANNG